MADFERNTMLGAILQTRPATEAELVNLRVLADRGLKQARTLAQQKPDSADAQYLLGSWLLYGYRVVQVDEITLDASGTSRVRSVNRVIFGLTDDPEEGLAALKKATELASDNGDYLLDYAAALGDYGRPAEARSILKGIWVGTPQLSTAQTMHAGFLLAGVSEAEGNLPTAREWIYSALALDPDTAMGVELLRHLDAVAAAEWRAALDAAVTAAQTGFEGEHYDEERYSEEQYPEEPDVFEEEHLDEEPVE